MVKGQQSLTILKIFRGCFAHLIRDGAALPTGQRICTTGGQKTETHHLGHLHLAVYGPFSGMCCIAVLMIHGAGAAVLNQVCHTGSGGIENHIIVNADKNLIDFIEPLHQCQTRPVNGHKIANESLKKVMVGIDKAWVHIFPGSIDYMCAVGAEVAPYSFDLVAIDKEGQRRKECGPARHRSQWPVRCGLAFFQTSFPTFSGQILGFHVAAIGENFHHVFLFVTDLKDSVSVPCIC